MDKKSILDLINSSVGEALQELKSQSKNSKEIYYHKKEYEDLDRSIRPTQVEHVQKDKIIKKNDGSKLVRAVRTPINFQKKIVQTATAFEFGEPVTLSAIDSNGLTKETLVTWDNLRLYSDLQELKKFSKSETESCLVFYITGEFGNRKMRSKVYSSKDGKMSPYFNDDDDMIFFTWSFEVENNEKTERYSWVYDDKKIYKFKETEDIYTLIESIDHGFDKIPIVYDCQNKVEYEDVKSLIDRYEVCLSKLGAANDYTGHPILMLKGEIRGMPDKDDDGKVLYTEKSIDPQTQKELSGEAEFLTYDNAPEAVKLELEQLRDFIGYITSTPDLSFNTLKSLGNVATETLQLMFLDPILKSKLNEGRNRTIVQRCLKIIESGIVNTLKTGLRGFYGSNRYNIKFNSVLPSNLSELMSVMSTGVDSGIVTKETAVKTLSLTNDSEKEIEQLQNITNVNNQS